MPNPVRQHLTGSATTVYEYEVDTQDMQQREVDVCDVWVFERIATQVDNKGLTSVRADVRRKAAEPL